MTIIEYKLHPSPKGMQVPNFVTDGGYWPNLDELEKPNGSEKLIGIGEEGSIPDSLTTFTLEELQARQRAIHAKNPMKKEPEFTDNMTDDEVDAMVKAWVDARS